MVELVGGVPLKTNSMTGRVFRKTYFVTLLDQTIGAIFAARNKKIGAIGNEREKQWA
jgi:hypothetical protein